MTDNCWDFMNCPQDKREDCNAYPNSGRSCWLVAGTLCNGCEKLGLFAEQIESCTICPWFKEVAGEYTEDLDKGYIAHCWEFWNCEKIDTCPAYPNDSAYCWMIAGTECQRVVEGKFADIYQRTLEGCHNCPWRIYRAKHPFVTVSKQD